MKVAPVSSWRAPMLEVSFVAKLSSPRANAPMLAAVTADAAGAADAAVDGAAAAELAAVATQLAQKVEATAPLQLDTSALVSGGAKKASAKRLILEIKLGSTATPATLPKGGTSPTSSHTSSLLQYLPLAHSARFCPCCAC